MTRRWQAVLLAVLALAGCGGGQEADGVASLGGGEREEASEEQTAAAEDPQEALLAFAACMREEGIDFPDPVIDGTRVQIGRDGLDADSEEFQAASEHCREETGLGLPGANRGPGAIGDQEMDPAERERMEEALLAFAACMREEGIDFPDPVIDGTRVQIGRDGLDADSEEFQAASEHCREETGLGLPGANRGPGAIGDEEGSG